MFYIDESPEPFETIFFSVISKIRNITENFLIEMSEMELNFYDF